MKTKDFDYYLPQELIAQTPVEPRDQSRLMVANRSDGSIRHHRFFEVVDYLQSLGATLPQEQVGTPENITFSMPKELRLPAN